MGHKIQEENLRLFVIATFFWPLMNTSSLLKIFSQWKVTRHRCGSCFFFNSAPTTGPGEDDDGCLTCQQLIWDWARAPTQALWRLVGGPERHSCGPERVCLREEAEGQGGDCGCLSLSTISQLARTGSRCRAATGQHLGRTSGSPLHI